ncbi:protease inhibitor I42 family protein [Erwinia papayae]|uniref:Protease inhibitor I42 family protein n=2 Tax=Erwinia papayae TaxID=206499 RepID=A0ABV3N883_9GAMM|nr:protease inhibitor I42 family protein [Salmonella enterica]ELQ0070768.1 protease inhibitor I42 family protein [Salmonella enterica]
MKIAKVIAASLAIAFSVSAVAAKDSTLINGTKGKEVQISLDSNPTTGYSWMIKKLPKELIFVSSSYEQSKECKDGAVGCSGKETFTFIAQKSGTDELKLIHGQPFDKSTWKENTVSVKIK